MHRYVRVNGLKTSVAAVIKQLEAEGFTFVQAPSATATDSTSAPAPATTSATASRPAAPSVVAARATPIVRLTAPKPAAPAAAPVPAPAPAQGAADSSSSWKRFSVDCHVPDLLVFESGSQASAYFYDHPLLSAGHIILQDKASCFPAFVLAQAISNTYSAPTTSSAPPALLHAVDACSAPGNKSTHLAALLHPHSATRYALLTSSSSAAAAPAAPAALRIDSIELDPKRYETLCKLIARATDPNAQPDTAQSSSSKGQSKKESQSSSKQLAAASAKADTQPSIRCVHAHNANFLQLDTK